MSFLKINKALMIIFLLSLLLPIGYSFIYRIEPAVDAKAYDKMAVNLISGFGFREESDKSFEFDTAIVRAGPAYEYFLAGVYKIFGHHIEIVWILQALLHAITALLIFLICRSLSGRPALRRSFGKGEQAGAFGGKEKGVKIGLIAAILFGFHPDLIEISAMLMTETLYLFWIVLAIYFFVKLFNEPDKLKFSVLLALSLGITVLNRPSAALFLPIILIFYLIQKRYKAMMIFLLLFILCLVPWTIRNYLVYHRFIPTTLIGEYNLWVGNTLSSTGGQFPDGLNPATDFAAQYGYSAFGGEAKRQFKEFVLSHPLVFVKLTFLRIVRYFSLIRPMGFWFYSSGLDKLLFVLSSLLGIGILFVSGLAGMFKALMEKSRLFNYLMIFALLAPLAIIFATVESRYRFQIYPFLAIFGAYFLSGFFAGDFRSIKAFKTSVLIFGIFTLADIFVFWPIVQERISSFL